MGVSTKIVAGTKASSVLTRLMVSFMFGSKLKLGKLIAEIICNGITILTLIIDDTFYVYYEEDERK